LLLRRRRPVPPTATPPSAPGQSAMPGADPSDR
jgi:hypothetical protein